MSKTLVALIVALSLPSFAAGVDHRANNLQRRINQGVATGELNDREAGRLEHQELRLREEIARDRADGPGLTAHERAKIQRQENRLSRRVYAQKHDAQTR